MIKNCLFLNNREPYPEDSFDRIKNINMIWCQDHLGGFSLEKALHDNPETHILVTTLMDLNAENLKKLPKLELIITITIGTDYIDKNYCQANNIKILNTPNYTGTSVAEHAVALMLSAAKRIVDFNSKVRTGDFQIFEHQSIELFNRKAGIIGLGSIGKQVATMLKGFGMQVLYCNRRPTPSDLGVQVNLDSLLKESDIVFLTLSMNNEAKYLINEESLSKMKKGVMLINISPDELIDLIALKHALEIGYVSYAGMDIHHENEDFLQLPNTLITPRRAWYTEESMQRRVQIFTQTLADYMSKLDHD